MAMDDDKSKTRHYRATDAFHDKLKKIASIERRSIQEQILYFLERCVKEYEKENPIALDGHEVIPIRESTIKEIRQYINAVNSDDSAISKSILVVDDSSIELALYTEILKGYKCNVAQAVTANEAITLYKEMGAENIDFVLIDYMLPGGMKGDELYLELLKINPEVKAIILTSDMRKSIEQRFNNIAPPPIKFIRKSVSKMEALIECLSQN